MCEQVGLVVGLKRVRIGRIRWSTPPGPVALPVALGIFLK